jgi:hypothetical protein
MTAVRSNKAASLVLTVVCTHSMSGVAIMRLAHVTTVARGLPLKITCKQNGLNIRQVVNGFLQVF